MLSRGRLSCRLSLARGPRWTTVVTSAVLIVAALAGSPQMDHARAAAPEQATKQVTHPVIPAFERFHAAQKQGSITGGQLLISELNCQSCHKGGVLGSGVKTKPAPVLDAVGSRVRPEWMMRFLANPHQSKPGTTMPDLFPGTDPEAEAAQVEALVNFLATTGSTRPTSPQPQAVSRGRNLFHQVGCVACHQPHRDPKSPVLPTSVPLGEIGKKYTRDSLAAFLKNPLAIRPGGRMPSLNLNDKEANDIASSFFEGVQLPPSLKYAFYEGRWDTIPDFNKLKPKSTGQASGFQLSVASRRDNFGLRFTGFLQVTRKGRYTFFLGSDDGSRLQLAGKTIVEVNGVHPYQEKNAAVELTPGAVPVLVDYFEASGQEVLRVDIQGPGLSRRSLATMTTLEEKPKRSKPVAGEQLFVPNPDLVAKGKGLFASLGCASCHQMKHGGKLIASTARPARPLAQVHPESGCLSAEPAAGVPRFGLSRPQAHSLAIAIKAPAADLPADKQVTARIEGTTQAFNCLACHARNKQGGVERARDPLFATTIKEMGDEGRIPPRLDGVGDKLNDSWIKHVLDNGANDRPYMLTRMPRFGTANVGHLVKDFATADRTSKAVSLAVKDRIHRVRSAGRFLAGDKALACIKCHYFGKHKATGIQSLDLLTMTRRLRKDWFVRYMLDPQAYRPGTRMPAGWPRGQTLLPDVLDGVPKHQIASVWEYLADGGKAGLPRGLIRNPIELEPRDEPIIYRNFITGVSPRGIAVGYPEKANLAFDADQIALRLIWHNAFIDAARHWNGRGQGFQPPLGDHLVTLSGGVPFATLDKPDSAWPGEPARKLGYRFRGYRIDKQLRPVFRYRFGHTTVEDHPVPVKTDKDAALVRTLTLTRQRDRTSSEDGEDSVSTLWYRAAAGPSIEKQKDGSFVVGKILSISIRQDGGAPVVLRRQGNASELLVPVHFDGNKAVIIHRYSW